MSLPNQEGFHWPAEWEPHDATWMSWPHREGISFPGSYDQVMPAFVAMVRAIARSEKVCINVKDAAQEKELRAYFGGDLPKNVAFFNIRTNEPWCRDHGPIFLVNREKRELAAIDWGYNAWGGKYPPFDADDKVPTHIAKLLGVKLYENPMVMEGGSIEGNGYGTLLTTEQCLLNPNRNPKMNRAQIEEALKNFLNIKQVLWLADGIEGDDTDGHVDDLTRFVNRTTVVTMVEPNREDPNHLPLQENVKRLRTMKLWDGSPLSIVELPMPPRIEKEDTRLPASYANFYIANKTVLLPAFNHPNDSVVKGILEGLFPGREIVPIDCRELIWGLGAFHCLTQQQPVP